MSGGYDLFYKDFIFKGVSFSKFHESSKFNNSTICYKNVFGLIQAFVIRDSVPNVICKNVYDINSFFYATSFPLNKHSSVCCHISKEDFFIAPAKEIKKVFLKISENRTFINFYYSTHFFT